MFEQLEEPEEKKPTNYTGVIIGIALLPVMILFTHLHKDDLGMAVYIVLGATILAVGIRWELKKRVWFWATIVFVLALHAYLLFVIQLPPGWFATIWSFHAISMLPIASRIFL
jgi:hypothetical protein